MYRAMPAYGRQFSTREKIIKDWADGKDFRLINGPYFSIRDFDSMVEDNTEFSIDKILFGNNEPTICIFFWNSKINSDHMSVIKVYADGSID